MEFDHLFICVDDPSLGDLLKDIGLSEGSANTHPGQGTANRRFFFNNAFIELLYEVDGKELKSELTSPTGLYQRLHSEGTATSPFGICFRPNASSVEVVPFSHWLYRPSYLPPTLAIPVGEAPMTEPMWFYLPFGARPDQVKGEGQPQQPLDHPCGMRSITSVSVTSASTFVLSDTADVANSVKGFEFSQACDNTITLEFDSGTANKRHDLRPDLPLILHG